jgi:antitoxin MazE
VYIFLEAPMQVAKWGNSLAVRLPTAVVEALGLKEGDQIEIRIAGERKGARPTSEAAPPLTPRLYLQPRTSQ